MSEHSFWGVTGHPDDDECTHREDGTDATYCGQPESAKVHDVWLTRPSADSGTGGDDGR